MSEPTAPRCRRDFLYHDCGLKGLSGISNDMRELQSSTHPRAAFAVDYFCYRIGLHAGMLAAALSGLDAFVFTAGIGENSAGVRARVVANLAWLGAALDTDANGQHATRISSPKSGIGVYVIPTDEELMIARHTLALLSTGARNVLRQGFFCPLYTSQQSGSVLPGSPIVGLKDQAP